MAAAFKAARTRKCPRGFESHALRTEIRTSEHVAVDARGLLLAMLITAASVQDRGAAKPLLWNLRSDMNQRIR